MEERTKKVSLIGTFGGITVDRVPSLAPPFCAFAVLTEVRGDADIDLVVSRLDTGEETYALHRRVHFPDDPLIEVGYVERIRQCQFPAPGYYQFTLLVDGEWVAQRRLRVRLKE